MVLFWLAVVTAALYATVALDVFIGNRSIRSLREVPPSPPPDAPAVSVIVAARNEERNLREALASLLELDYPKLELIVVDDRSEDGTGLILDRMAAENPRLEAIHLTELPDGWLGKNHALWYGATRGSGEIFLFTDADIVMEPTVLNRSVRFFVENRLAHLAVTPRMTMPGTILSMFGVSVILFFSMYARPWKVRDPKSRSHIGIGAFNMVRRDAYRAVGGHEKIRLRPDDDLKLGKILKQGGYRSEVAYGPEFLSVEWYSSVGQAIRGLEKNAFAGCEYRVSSALFAVVFYLMGSVFPYIALFLTNGATRMMNAAVIVVITALIADCTRFHGAKRRHAIGFAPSAALMCWIILRTTALNLAQGGITWRGTFYPLSELKKNVV